MGVNIFINIVIGLVIGLAIGWFLIAPLRINNAQSGVNEEVVDLREQLAIKTAALDDLTQKSDKLKDDNSYMEEVLERYEGTDGVTEAHRNLMLALIEYNKSNRDQLVVAEYLERIDDTFIEDSASEEFIQLFTMMKDVIGQSVANSYYQTGNEAYRALTVNALREKGSKSVII